MNILKNLASIILLSFVIVPAFSEADSPQGDLLPKYENFLGDFPAKTSLDSCVAPQSKLNKKTNRYRTAIASRFKEAGEKPNFCGKYFLMETPITGGGDLFFFDCANGKPIVYTPKAAATKPMMKLESCAFVVNPPLATDKSSDFAKAETGSRPEPALGSPRIYRFDGKNVFELEDKFWPK